MPRRRTFSPNPEGWRPPSPTPTSGKTIRCDEGNVRLGHAAAVACLSVLGCSNDFAQSRGSTPIAVATAATSPGALASQAPGRAQGFAKNPIVSHVFTADPSADVYGDRVYVFTSHDLDDQTDYTMTDYHVFSSDDMVNWQDHGVVLDVANIPWAKTLYAPDSCTAHGRYYLYFPDGGSSIGVAVAEHPTGPFVDALGKPLITRDTPGVEDVEWVFDPTCFVDDDGRAYLYFGGGPDGSGDNGRVIRLGADMVSLAEPAATTILAPDFFEASFMHKHDGKYYYSYSTGFSNHAAFIDYMVSDAPMSGFQYQGTVLQSPFENNSNNNHHSIVEFRGQWYMFYHNRLLANQLGKSSYQRSITVDLLSYATDGRINTLPTKMGSVPQLTSVNARGRIEAELIAAELGVETQNIVTDEYPGVALSSLDEGDWVAVSQVDFANGAARFLARVATSSAATISVVQGSCEPARTAGKLVGQCAIPNTGGVDSWQEVNCPVQAAAGVHDVCLRFGVTSGQSMRLDHYRFE